VKGFKGWHPDAGSRLRVSFDIPPHPGSFGRAAASGGPLRRALPRPAAASARAEDPHPPTAVRPVIPELRTPRLLLRSLAGRDREEFVRVHTVSETFFAPWSALEESHEALFDAEMAKVEAGRQSGRHARFVGVLNDGRIAGFFNLGEIVRGAFDNAYVGWRVNAEVARQGYATEGVGAVLDLAFHPDGFGLHRIQANVIPSNRASLRLAERLGFRREGLAERYLKIAGAWQDHVMFAKTAEEHRFAYLEAAGDPAPSA
jgi:[ribosomal protein S5]-alanine N-acetyltransferase